MSVRDWLGALENLPLPTHLSEAGARQALRDALDSLADLDRVEHAAVPDHTVMVCASTVFTAPLEWAAVSLMRGGRFTIKAPRALEGWFADVAGCTDLPLASTTDRAVLASADAIVAMGSDATMAALRDQLAPHQRLLAFGHRFSVAWFEDPASSMGVARDLVLHDGRGCMSPVAIFSPLPNAGALLSAALESWGEVLPRGPLSPTEHARIRERIALGRVLGTIHTGATHAVLTWNDPTPRAALPRVAHVHPSTWQAFQAFCRRHENALSTIGSDRPFVCGTVRVCAPGEMQRPPLRRLHDGVDWLKAYTASRMFA